MESKSSICDTCIIRLQDAAQFKEQVMLCEQALGRLYNRHMEGIEIRVIKEEHDSTSNGVKKEDDSLHNSERIEYKYCEVKIEPVDAQDGDDQPLSVLRQESQGDMIPQHNSEDFKMAGRENLTENINTIAKLHVRNGCSQTENFRRNNQPKTAAERMRDYRSRMKKKRQQNDVNRPKTAAERMREYRARKRRKNEIEISINDDGIQSDKCEFVASTSELFALSYVRRPKTVLERVREHRARKKNAIIAIPKSPKTAKERVQEYRARKKNLAQ